MDKSSISADTKVSDIVYSLRIYRALQRSGIETIGDLRALNTENLLKVRNLGEKGIAELDEYLQSLKNGHHHL